MTKLLVLVLVIVVLYGNSYSLTPVVQVNINPLIVSRGGHLFLNNSFTVDSTTLRPGSVCEISYINKPRLSCGEVSPKVFPCDYDGAIRYQHFGCLLDKQLVTLQLSSVVQSNLSEVDIHIFSIELLVKNHDMLSSIQLHRVDADPLEFLLNKTVNTYKLVFPPKLVRKCYYEVLNSFEHLNLPMYGEILPSANAGAIVPCGFTYNLQYARGNYVNALIDFILLRVYFYHEFSNVTVHYAPIALGEHSKNIDRDKLTSRMPKTYTVRQAANAPVTPSNLIDGINPIKYIVEIHPLIGSFRTPQASIEHNISFTEFSQEDLLTGGVSFYPQYNSPLYPPINFRLLAIFDILGYVSKEDDILVTSEHLVHFDQVVQRINNPLKVVKGGMVWIDSQAIEFYLPVHNECYQNTRMRLVVAPRHGYIAQSNGSQIRLTTFFSVKLVSKGTVLAYKHSGDEFGFDQMVWEVNCLKAPVLKVSMTVWVAKVHSFQPVHFESTKMFAYKEWYQPLTLFNFKAVGGHSILDNIIVNVYKANGSLVKVTTSSLEFNTPSWLFPLVKLDPYSFSKATSFLLSEVQQQLVWYIAPSKDWKDTIEICVIDSYGSKENISINVDVFQQNISEFMSVSTTNDVYTKLSNMTVRSTQPVYLTSHYLLSTLVPFSDENIVYLLANQLQKGKLCVITHTTCLNSIKQFTQQDINQQKIYFLPTSNFTRDVITLEITVGNIKLHSPKMVSIEIKKIQKIDDVVKTFWIRDGREKRLRPDHFPAFSRSAKFVVIQGTEYGKLSFRFDGFNSDLHEFNHKDLANSRVWYKHNSATLACSDFFKYNVTLENQTMSFNFLLLIRQSRKKLSVTISDRPYNIFEHNRFTIRKESFLVQSSFCPEFVTFNVVAPPQLGVLSLIDLEYSVVVHLDTNSKFTLKHINTGLVHYTLLDSNIIQNSTSDFVILNASDPISYWPLEWRQTPHVGRFELLIDTKSEVKKLDLKIKTPRTVSWLPEYKKYGAVIGQQDIDITNSSVDPTEVNIQVNFDLNHYYQLEIDSNSVSVFTLNDIYSGRVIFTKIMFQENTFQDAITFAVNVEVEIRNETFTALGGTHSLTFVWAFIQFSADYITLSEEREYVNFTIR